MENNNLKSRLQLLVDHLDDLNPQEINLLERSFLPALEAFFNGNLNFFCTIALGDDLTIQDWFNIESEELLFEAAGRLQALSGMLAAFAFRVSLEPEENEACDDCLHHCSSPTKKEEKGPN